MLIAWGLWRSFELSGWEAEIGSRWTRLSAVVLLVLLGVGFCELQPVVLDGIFRSAHNEGGPLADFVGWLKGLAAVLAPFSAVVAFFSRHIGHLLKEGAEKPSFTAVALRAAGKAAVYVAGAAIPFLLWMAYLYLSFAGIKDVHHPLVSSTGPYYHAATSAAVDPFVFRLSIFVLAIFVGYYVVWSVTPALHTPLMSVTNAISSVIVVGALLAVGVPLVTNDAGPIWARAFGFIALVLASVNIFGGFLVTQRMLGMYQKKKK